MGIENVANLLPWLVIQSPGAVGSRDLGAPLRPPVLPSSVASLPSRIYGAAALGPVFLPLLIDRNSLGVAVDLKGPKKMSPGRSPRVAGPWVRLCLYINECYG